MYQLYWPKAENKVCAGTRAQKNRPQSQSVCNNPSVLELVVIFIFFYLHNCVFSFFSFIPVCSLTILFCKWSWPWVSPHGYNGSENRMISVFVEARPHDDQVGTLWLAGVWGQGPPDRLQQRHPWEDTGCTETCQRSMKGILAGAILDAGGTWGTWGSELTWPTKMPGTGQQGWTTRLGTLPTRLGRPTFS